MRLPQVFRTAWMGRASFFAAGLLPVFLWILSTSAIAQEATLYLGEARQLLRIEHQQQWGDFGWNTAAAAAGGTGSPLRIGSRTYVRGLGHHANGEIVVPLNGRFVEFRSLVGVQWQGGDRGSVVFRVLVDDRVVFESDPMTDSDPERAIQVPLAGARELRLVAADAGDGIACDMANWAESRLVADPSMPLFGPLTADFNGSAAPAASPAASGFCLMAAEETPQIAVMAPAGMLAVDVRPQEEVRLTVPIQHGGDLSQVLVEAHVVYGEAAEVGLSLGGPVQWVALQRGQLRELSVAIGENAPPREIVLLTRGTAADTAVRWQRLRFAHQDRMSEIPLVIGNSPEQLPPPVLPELRSPVEKELIEWDWRLQDGIGTARRPGTWQQAIEITLARGDVLLQHLPGEEDRRSVFAQRWAEVREAYQSLSASGVTGERHWESLWRRSHWLRREIALANPLADVGPIVFAKRVPSSFSHQLTQYIGRAARPGGGIFVLESPGSSMRCRQLAVLPAGSYLHPDVSWDGKKVLFAFCEVDQAAADYHTAPERFYHLYDVNADGTGLRQLTHGSFDDFSPRYLPDDEIVFTSTRRGGFHRCGRGPCPVYTLTVVGAEGGEPRVISFHETHEWDPAVLHDGRVVYTRWDYVDRHAVHYQQLWSVRPDGSNVSIFYGNNTLNPVGVWEARPVPGSNLVMATAAAHHAMTAGSIILLDVSRGVDGLQPITRLTPDALFPESEVPVQHWHAPAGVTDPPAVPLEEQRWPGHCYRTPFPLSEDYFLAAYSFEPLIGEPGANPANMFGIYLVDRFGNKELLYRDLSIGSLWPMPLRPRTRPPALASALDPAGGDVGTFFVQNVYDSWPRLVAKGRRSQTAAHHPGAAQDNPARQHAPRRICQRVAGQAGAGHGAGRVRRLGLLPTPRRGFRLPSRRWTTEGWPSRPCAALRTCSRANTSAASAATNTAVQRPVPTVPHWHNCAPLPPSRPDPTDRGRSAIPFWCNPFWTSIVFAAIMAPKRRRAWF